MTTSSKNRAPALPIGTLHVIETLEHHTDALHRFRRALCGLDKQDRIADAERISKLVTYYAKKTREQRKAKE